MISVISFLTDSFVRCSVYGILRILLRHLNLKACIFFTISAESVQASQPYKAVDMTMARNSLIFVLMEIDLFLNRGCNFASADVAMANLSLLSLSNFPSFVMWAPK